MARRPKFTQRIKHGQISDWPAGIGTPDEIASRVTYTGSPLHTTYPSPSGPPAFRSDKLRCYNYPQDQWPRLVEALRQAIRAGFVSGFRGRFPERAWAWINGVLHEARLTNSEIGDYHGFPINDERQYPRPANRLEAAPRVEIPVV